MIKLCILFIVLLIVGLQIFQNRLLTSVTVWVGCYCCYFLIAPLLLNDKNNIVEKYAVQGIASFFVGYILVVILKNFFPFQFNKHIQFTKNILSVQRFRNVCDYALFLTIIFLVFALGKNGVLSFFSGQLAAKNYLIEKEGIFVKLYSFMIELIGYMFLYLFIKTNGKIDKKFVIRISIYGLIMFFFAFTRAPIILLMASLFLYKLRKEKASKQLCIMGILVVFGVIMMILMGYIRIYGAQGLKNLSVGRMMKDLAGSIDFTIPYMDFQREIDQNVRISPLVYMKPIFMIIPRSIWNNKPLASTIQILNCIDPNAMARGYSTGFTILGEGLAVFGEKGIWILPFLWSIVCTTSDEIYIRKIVNGTDNDFATCAYVIFMAYIVVQCHRQGTDAVMVYFIIAILWLFLSSKVKLMRVKSGFRLKLRKG